MCHANKKNNIYFFRRDKFVIVKKYVYNAFKKTYIKNLMVLSSVINVKKPYSATKAKFINWLKKEVRLVSQFALNAKNVILKKNRRALLIIIAWMFVCLILILNKILNNALNVEIKQCLIKLKRFSLKKLNKILIFKNHRLLLEK